jgi:hypothetical protein
MVKLAEATAKTDMTTSTQGMREQGHGGGDSDPVTEIEEGDHILGSLQPDPNI